MDRRGPPAGGASITRGTNTLLFFHDPTQELQARGTNGTTLYFVASGAMAEMSIGSNGAIQCNNYLTVAGDAALVQCVAPVRWARVDPGCRRQRHCHL